MAPTRCSSIRNPMLLLCLILLLASCMSSERESSKQFQETDGSSHPPRKLAESVPCVKWGGVFDVPLASKNLVKDCKGPSGAAVCCEAVDKTVSWRGIGNDYTSHSPLSSSSSSSSPGSGGGGNSFEAVELVPKAKRSRSLMGLEFLEQWASGSGGAKQQQQQQHNSVPGTEDDCVVTKEYFSSPHEARELLKAREISLIGSDLLKDGSTVNAGVDDGSKLPVAVHDKRLEALLAHILSPDSRKNATIWLDRVTEHMRGADVPEGNPQDLEFLSRFEYTKTCTTRGGEGGNNSNNKGKVGTVVSSRWTEWIEPLTVTTRHPFSYSTCKKIWQNFKDVPRTGRSDVDYVLLKSGKQLHLEEEAVGNKRKKGSNRSKKHYLLDAGTSKFESSLSWFTCAFSQRKIAFDGVYAWEKTLLEPSDYWARVPPKWIPYWHFFNDAISADEAAHNSPVRMLKQMAGPEDFVAWKLDIDHPETEMPIATSLLTDSAFAGLVDEFFFELHYRCEVMTSCGWGKRVPAQHSGLELERATVMKYFIDLRKAGIRAHAWP